MGGNIVPEEYWSIPGWRNAFENTAAVQFHHRVLALSTLTCILGTWAAHRQARLPKSCLNLLGALVAVSAAQVLCLNHVLLACSTSFFPLQLRSQTSMVRSLTRKED